MNILIHGMHKAFLNISMIAFIFCPVNAMDIVPREYIQKYGYGAHTRKLEKTQHELAVKEGKFFIQTNDTQMIGSKQKPIIIPVSKEVFMLSQTLKNSLGDIEGVKTTTEPIPLTYSASTSTIRTGFNLLSLYNPKNTTDIRKNLQGLSGESLIDVANLFNYLEVPKKIDELVMDRLSFMTKDMNADQAITALSNLNSNLREQIFLDRIIPYLKTKAIQRRGQNIHREYWSDNSNDSFFDIQLSPNGKYILSQPSTGNDLVLWDMQKGSITKKEYLSDYITQDTQAFAYPDHKILFFQVSPNSKYIAVGYEKDDNYLDTTVMIWDIETETIIKEFRHIKQIISAQFSPDSQKIIAIYKGNNQNLVLWDMQTETITKTLDGHNSNVTSAMFSTDGQYIISTSRGNQNNLILWNAETGTIIKSLDGHQNDVDSAVFSPNNQYLISVAKPNTPRNLIFWDLETSTIKKQFSTEGIVVAKFSPDSSKIVVHEHYKDIFLWDMENQTDILLEPNQIIKCNINNIGQVPFSPDSTLIALIEGHQPSALGETGGIYAYLTLRSTKTGKIIQFYPQIDIIQPQFSPDGTYIVSQPLYAPSATQLILWQLISKQEKQDFDNLIHHSYNKIELLYRLCTAQERNTAINLREAEWKLLDELAPSIRNILQLNFTPITNRSEIPYVIPAQTPPGYLQRLQRYIASWVSYLKQ